MPHRFPYMRAQARQQIRRVIIAAAGALMLAIGVGFLVAALWKVMAAEFSPVVASIVIAVVFLGSGLVAMAVARQAPDPAPLHRRAQADTADPDDLARDYPALTEAFLFGLRIYRQVRTEQDRHKGT